MDTNSSRSIALLAIKPRFADAIIDGRKSVEFRKTRFSQPPNFIVLYASAPVKQIVAYFEVSYIKELTPKGLWRQFRENGCIDYDEFADYYRTTERGLAIGVGEVRRLETPTNLRHLDPSLSVPQSFRYLDRKTFLKVLGR